MKTRFCRNAYLLCAFITVVLFPEFARSQDAAKNIFTPTPVNTSYLSNLSGKFEKINQDVIKNLPKENKDAYKEAYDWRTRWKNVCGGRWNG